MLKDFNFQGFFSGYVSLNAVTLILLQIAQMFFDMICIDIAIIFFDNITVVH